MGTSSILNLVEKQQRNLLIKEARNGSPIPVVDCIHIHSAYNPEREARAFIEKYEETLKNHSNILLLGFGFGYHLVEVESFLYKHHGENNYKVIVIEPNNLLIEEAKAHKRLPVSKNISYYATTDIEKLYQQRELIDFLVEHPGIVMHTASFNLNRSFYESFLSHRAQNTIFEARTLMISEGLNSFLDHYPDGDQFSDIVKKAKKSESLRSIDHIAIAVDSIKKGLKLAADEGESRQ